MKLSQCKIGTIVCMKDSETNKITHIGHIVDIDLMYSVSQYKYCMGTHQTNNTVDDVRPFVKFAGEKYPRAVSPCNLEIYKD